MLRRLAAIPHLKLSENAPLRRYTRFALGGPAKILADAWTEEALAQAIATLQSGGEPWMVIGGGSNLVVDDEGYPGVILRYVSASLKVDGTRVTVHGGAVLQDLVDFSLAHSLQGMETMTGIPGWVSGAIYGNAGAYGRSIHQVVERVRFFDGEQFRELDKAGCEFEYRESIFKRNKGWVITSAVLNFTPGDQAALRSQADSILKIRDEKYPPNMRCAGSIFKNIVLKDLSPALQRQVPARVVKEGKVPSAYFLEEVGAKGMREGGIQVADYHANLIYNDGNGTAAEVRKLIQELKARVEDRFDLRLEEEVQYVGAAKKGHA
jgi:UDP-N-acetylmuramate dehydrogenase